MTSRIRTSILRFAKLMERNLCRNDHKGGWSRESIGYLKRRLKDEVRELDFAVKKKDVGRIKYECADIANFAMMIADVVEEQDDE